VTSYVLDLWPFVTKRTLKRTVAREIKEAVYDAICNSAGIITSLERRLAFWHSRVWEMKEEYRVLLDENQCLRRELAEADSRTWRKQAAENAQLRTDLQLAADQIVRLKGGR